MEISYLKACEPDKIRKIVRKSDGCKLFYVPYHIYSGDTTLVLCPLVFGELPSINNIFGIRNRYLREAREREGNPSFQRIESEPLDPSEVIGILRKMIEDIDLLDRDSLRDACSYAKELQKWNLSRIFLIPMTRYPSHDRSMAAARMSSIVAKAVVEELKLRDVGSLKLVGVIYCPEMLVSSNNKVQIYELLARGPRKDQIHTELYNFARSRLKEVLDDIPFVRTSLI